MPIVAKGKITSTTPGGYFDWGVTVQLNGRIDVVYAKTNTDSFNPPWPVTLYSEQFSDTGKLLQKLTAVAGYTVPPTSDTGATFRFHYQELELSASRRGVVWTQPVGDYASSSQTEIELQLLNSAGAKVTRNPITLALTGKGTSVTDLYATDAGAESGFGKSFMIVYSTYSTATEHAQIRYETFSDSGKAERGGVIQTFTSDNYHHSPYFGSYFEQGNSSKRDYIEMNLASNTLSQIDVRTFSPSGGKGPFHLVVDLTPPSGDAVYGVQGYIALKPGDSGTKDNYGVLAETFSYLSGSGNEIALQTVDAAGQITHRADIMLSSAAQSFVNADALMCHVGSGDIVVGYNSGSASYLQEYNNNLQMIGGAIPLADSTGDLNSLVSLGGDRFEAFWRYDSSVGLTSNVLHSQIFTAAA